MAATDLYDRIATAYTGTRRSDPRIAGLIWTALGDARSVVNVGAGTGAYEPTDREVIAIEPSAGMIAQRPSDAPPVIQAAAERLPLADDSVDAAMAVLTLHHWTDYRRGLLELRRVARKRVVVATWDPAFSKRFWLTRDYFRELGRRDAARFPSLEAQVRGLGGAAVIAVPIPHDCRDGFEGAFWRRPGAYLDPAVRAGISTFHLCSEAELAEPLRRLRADLESGRWIERNGALLEREELDLGYRLLVAGTGRVPFGHA
jgi:SAM-dependent methyltransferase